MEGANNKNYASRRENNRIKGDKEETRELSKLHAKREIGD